MRDREIKEQLSIRLPIDWVDRIYQIAEKERKSMNQVINELVERLSIIVKGGLTNDNVKNYSRKYFELKRNRVKKRIG